MSRYCAGELQGIRLLLLWFAGILCSIVLLLFAINVIQPKLQKAFAPEYKTINTTQWSPNMFEEVNTAIEEGWKVQLIGNDSCGNIYVCFTR